MATQEGFRVPEVLAGALVAGGGYPAKILLQRKETIAVVESSAGGLVSAMLMAAPRSSRFFSGNLMVYSNIAAKALLPQDVLQQLGVPKDNYADPDSYRNSKKTFSAVLARHARDRFGSTWAIAEAGATDAAALPRKLQTAGAFSCIALVGPDGFEHVQFIEGGPEREKNMWVFAYGAMRLVSSGLENAASGCSKL